MVSYSMNSYIDANSGKSWFKSLVTVLVYRYNINYSSIAFVIVIYLVTFLGFLVQLIFLTYSIYNVHAVNLLCKYKLENVIAN